MRTKELEAALAYADNAETQEHYDALCHKSAERKDTISECVQYILAAEVRRLEAENEKAKHAIADLLGCKTMEANQ